MEHIVGVAVASHNVAPRADRGGPGKGSAGIIEGVECAPAQQIGMSDTIDRIPSDHFTAGIDPGHVRVGNAAPGASIVVNWPSLSSNPWFTLSAPVYTPTISPPLIPRSPAPRSPGRTSSMVLNWLTKGAELAPTH